MAKRQQPNPFNVDGERKIVSWEDPPPAPTGNAAYTDIVKELKEHPGAWARLDDRASENAAQAFTSMVRNGKVAGFRGARFDARHSGPSVWVCYLGEREIDMRGWSR